MIKKYFQKKKKNEAASARSGRIADFVAKILCLIAAFFIWFYAMSTDVITLEKDYTVPIKIEKETELFEKTGWSVLSGKESQIVVTLKGKRNIMAQITESDITAFVDVSGVEKAGMQELEIKVNAPTECEIVKKSVSTLFSYVDKNVTKNIPIKARFYNFFEIQEYKHDEPAFNINEIAITGPESELALVSAALADWDYGHKELTQTVTAVCSLKLVDSDNNEIKSNYITWNTKTVNVTIKVYSTKEVPLSVDYKYGYFNEKNVKITITPAVITLRGDPSVLNEITEINLTTLDEKKFLSNSTQSLEIILPDGVTSMSEETTASVTVEHINTTTKQVAVKNISLINSGGLDCILQTTELNITLRGPRDMLSRITEEDITVSVDMKNYKAGSGITIVPATVKISSEYSAEVYELESYSVNVNIK